MVAWLTVIAIGCPTGTSFDPSGANIFARYLQESSDHYNTV